MSEREFIKNIKKIKELFPFEIVQGDCIMRTNPHSSVCLNSSASWLVSQDIKSAHKLRTVLEDFNKMADSLIQIDSLMTEFMNTSDSNYLNLVCKISNVLNDGRDNE